MTGNSEHEFAQASTVASEHEFAISEGTFLWAFRRVLAKRKAAGLDGIEPTLLLKTPRLVRAHAHRAYGKYRSGSWSFIKARRVVIERGGKKRERPLPGIPDAGFLRSILCAFNPVWDAIPLPILGGRPGASVPQAVKGLHRLFWRYDPQYIAKYDLADAFLRCDPERALDFLDGLAPERHREIGFLRRWYARQRRAGFRGLLEGTAPASLLLAAEMARHVVPIFNRHALFYIVWADDIIAGHETNSDALSCRRALEAALPHGQELHPWKTCIYPAERSNWSFLGYSWYTGEPLPHISKVAALVKRVGKLLRERGVGAANASIRGWTTTFTRSLVSLYDKNHFAWVDDLLADAYPGVPLLKIRDLIEGPAHPAARSAQPRAERWISGSPSPVAVQPAARKEAQSGCDNDDGGEYTRSEGLECGELRDQGEEEYWSEYYEEPE